MKRLLLGALLTAALFAAATGLYLLQPDPLEEFPLAGRVPADAVVYAGFADYRELDALPTSIIGPLREKIADAESALAGPVAVYLDADLNWVFLARLTRTARVFATGEVIDGVAVVAQTPEALERHRSGDGALRDTDAFRKLRSRIFVNLDALRLPERLRDFSAAGFEFDPGPPLALRGRALYHGGVFRLFAEHYFRAAPPAPPTEEAPFALTFTEHFPRLWDEITHELSVTDQERLRQAVFVLNRDFLDGEGMRNFLGRIGPACGLAIVPTEHDLPALVGWVDVPGRDNRKTLEQILHKAGSDIAQYFRDRGEAPPFQVTHEKDLWRVRLRGQEAWRLGAGFSPAYVIRDKRLLFTTCASVLESGGAADGGTHHVNASIRIGSLIDLLDTLVPVTVDGTFREKAERDADVLFGKLYGPTGMAALRRTLPDASTRETFLAQQRALLTAKALKDLSGTEGYQREEAQVRESLNALRSLLEEVDRFSLQGRFSADGLRLDLEAYPR